MKFFKTGKVRFTALLLIPILLIGIIFVTPVAKRVQAEEAVHTYTESLDEIVNPAAGFYKRVGVKLSRGSSTLAPGILGNIAAYAKNYGIIQLCFDLSAFSGAVNKVSDYEIDSGALAAIESVFAALRTNKVGAIIRFDYNRDGVSGDREPSLDMVKEHIRKISTAVTKYSDVILSVESGMLGKWGEQHSSTLANDWTNYYDIVETWLQSTPQNIGITVRRPVFFVYWANEKYGLNLTVNDLADFDFSAYPAAKRVGVYNDGYLGSSNDLGTFTNRNIETAFIGKQAEYTYYGGELVADGSMGGVVGNYNSVSFLETEGFVTHTSYLNIDWNDKVFDQYRANTYDGVDRLYNGKTTEFTFVKNRLGYRFYLSSSTDSSSDETDELNLKFTVANAGFARLLRPSRSELVFVSATKSVAVDCTDGVDLRQVPSAGDKTFELSVAIPEELPYGDCEVYLRFYTQYGAEIKMANDTSICAPDREGVKVATVTKKAPVTLASIAVTSDPVKTTYKVGDALDLTGLAVTATYSDDSTVPVTVTTDMLSDYDMTVAGTYHVKISYEGKSATFGIVVSAAQPNDPPEEPPVEPKPPAVTVRSVAVKVYPTKTTYTIGETLDLSGLAVTAAYSDGTTSAVTVTADMLSGYDMTVVGTQTVKITYEGKVTGFNIIVREKQVPPGDGENDKNFLRDNAVLIGCIAAAVVAVVAVVIVVAVKLKHKK